MKRIIVLQQPPAPVMDALLEHTCELARSLPHVEGARVLARRVSSEGRIMTRQQWRARARVPSLLQPHVESGLHNWTLEFERHTQECAVRWQAESVAVRCRGTLDFMPALGGRGTFITLRCDVPGASQALRTIFGAMVERHWRALAQAAAAHAGAASAGRPAG